MTSEIICALITAGGVLFSAIVSYAISRSTANKEIEKLKLTWEREDVVSSDDEFAEMAEAVAKFIHNCNSSNQRDALGKVAAIRSKETGELGALLDKLYAAIRTGIPSDANEQLTKVINQKRETKSKANAPKGNKPNK